MQLIEDGQPVPVTELRHREGMHCWFVKRSTAQGNGVRGDCGQLAGKWGSRGPPKGTV